MKNSIKKLLSSAVIAFISIGVNFNTNARVTREVAEATLPYLMEAAGIPKAQQTREHQKAVISMIYTDKGQQEMVEWAKKGDFPESLKAGGFTPRDLYSDGWLIEPLKAAGRGICRGIGMDMLVENLKQGPLLNPYSMLSYAIQAVRDAYIGALFPCGPGTFSSYAAHPSRLGHWVLNAKYPQDVCSAVIKNQANNKLGRDAKEIINRLGEYHNNIDSKLASIIFILDICDTCEQVKDILTQVLGVFDKRNTDIDDAVTAISYNEYNHRPVSATSAGSNQRNGDCVETLYRHLINIAIQNDSNKPHQYDIKNLPEQLRTYYYKSLYDSHLQDNTLTIPKTKTEAGKTMLDVHNTWKNALAASIFAAEFEQKQKDYKCQIIPYIAAGQKDITKDTQSAIITRINEIFQADISNIATILHTVSTAGTQSASEVSTDTVGAREYMKPNLSPQISSSQSQQDNANKIQEALNALDGKCNSDNERFIVHVNDDPRVIPQTDLLNGINVLIEIADRLWNRTIKVGMWEKHAEIVSIDDHTVRSTQ